MFLKNDSTNSKRLNMHDLFGKVVGESLLSLKIIQQHDLGLQSCNWNDSQDF